MHLSCCYSESDYLCNMKAMKILMLILTMMSAKTPSHAQFNTIGYVKKHSISKKKSPQETSHVASVASVMRADSLPPDSSQDVLPYLRASFPLKNIQINSKFGMRNHPDKKEYEAMGHCSAYSFPDGDYFFCHGYSVPKNGASILVQKKINWTEEGWLTLE